MKTFYAVVVVATMLNLAIANFSKPASDPDSTSCIGGPRCTTGLKYIPSCEKSPHISVCICHRSYLRGIFESSK